MDETGRDMRGMDKNVKEIMRKEGKETNRNERQGEKRNGHDKKRQDGPEEGGEGSGCFVIGSRKYPVEPIALGIHKWVPESPGKGGI